MGKPKDWDDEMDGEWEPPMIDNPEYNADDAKDIGKYEENCKIGFDLWQVKSGTIFDNVLITDDAEHAKKVGEELWAVTKEAEKKKKEEEAKSAGDDEDEDDEDLDDEEPEDEEDSEEPADDEEDAGHDE